MFIVNIRGTNMAAWCGAMCGITASLWVAADNAC